MRTPPSGRTLRGRPGPAGWNKLDFGPQEAGCGCFACRHFTCAYLRQLLNVDETPGVRMLSLHNTHFYLRVVADIRAHRRAGTFGEFRRGFIARYKPASRVLADRMAHAEK